MRGVPLRLRMLPWALGLPVLKHVLPLPVLARVCWSRRRSRRPVAIEFIVRAGLRTRPIPSRGNCLERSLLLYRYLSWAGAEPTLATGVRLEDGRLHGHAWVTVTGVSVGESPEEVGTYTPVVSFGPQGRLLTEPASCVSDAQLDEIAAAVLNAAGRRGA
jgi:hypothetical protein